MDFFAFIFILIFIICLVGLFQFLMKKTGSDTLEWFMWNYFWWDVTGIFTWGRFYDDIYIFNNKLLEMVELNIPLDMAIQRILEDGIGIIWPYSPLKKPLIRIMKNLQSGSSFGEALQKDGTFFFPEFYINLIKVGEKEERLKEVLQALKGYLKWKKQNMVNYVHALSYLIITLTITLAISNFLVAYILPTYVELFEGMNMTLPFLTILLILTVKLLKNLFFIIPFFLFIFIVIFFIRNYISRILLKIPVLKDFIKNQEYITFCYVMSGLLKWSMPLGHSLEMASGAAFDGFYKNRLHNASLTPEATLRGTLKKTGLFDDPFLFMVSLGENTENLPEVFSEMAQYYENNYKLKIKSAFQVLEISLTGLIGVAVGITIIAVLTPMTNLVMELSNSIFY